MKLAVLPNLSTERSRCQKILRKTQVLLTAIRKSTLVLLLLARLLARSSLLTHWFTRLAMQQFIYVSITILALTRRSYLIWKGILLQLCFLRPKIFQAYKKKRESLTGGSPFLLTTKRLFRKARYFWLQPLYLAFSGSLCYLIVSNLSRIGVIQCIQNPSRYELLLIYIIFKLCNTFFKFVGVNN